LVGELIVGMAEFRRHLVLSTGRAAVTRPVTATRRDFLSARKAMTRLVG
jgi:hypothetical protein